MVQGSASLIFTQWENLKEVKLGVCLYLEEIFPALLNSKSIKKLEINQRMMQQLEVRVGAAVVPFKISVNDLIIENALEMLNKQFGILENRAR
jgi:hypothetical protein